MKKVSLSYALSFFYVGLNFGLAWLVSTLIKPPSVQLFPLIGIIVLGAAGLDKIGRSPQTWDGNTPPEKFDRCLFYCLSHFGLFLTFFGWISEFGNRP
ncbi:MAG: hypothetical protein IPP68_07500 [Elusimicrobia bacterium]|nr:hypothetical protein [Elusimicrobiota bacterium]